MKVVPPSVVYHAGNNSWEVEATTAGRTHLRFAADANSQEPQTNDDFLNEALAAVAAPDRMLDDQLLFKLAAAIILMPPSSESVGKKLLPINSIADLHPDLEDPEAEAKAQRHALLCSVAREKWVSNAYQAVNQSSDPRIEITREQLTSLGSMLAMLFASHAALDRQFAKRRETLTGVEPAPDSSSSPNGEAAIEKDGIKPE